VQLPKEARRRLFVHLAYLDDSDTKSKHRKWQVMSAVVIEDYRFPMLEIVLDVIREDLIPAEKIDEFEELHAAELYGGYGVFEGIDQEKRFDAIRQVLRSLTRTEASVVYGAVDLEALRKKVYASADPLDITFRACLKGIRGCVRKAIDREVDSIVAEFIDPEAKEKARIEAFKLNVAEQLAILIVDDFPDKKTKELLSKSFRNLREKSFSHFHDDIYFGDSRYSIGIQLADLCSYFIARHLNGDPEIEPFYEIIKPHLAFSETHPMEESSERKNWSALAGLTGDPNPK
jgi:hypothetical protein